MAEPSTNPSVRRGRISFFSKSLSVSATILFAAITLVSVSCTALDYFLITQEMATSNANQLKRSVAGAHLVELVALEKQIEIDVIQAQRNLSDYSATRGQDDGDDGLARAEKFAKRFPLDIAAAKDAAQAIGSLEVGEALIQIAIRFPELYRRGEEMAKVYAASGPAAGNLLMKDLDRLSGDMQAQIGSANKALEAAERRQDEESKAEIKKIDGFREFAARLGVLNIFIVTLTCLVSVFVVRRWFVQPLSKLARESHFLAELSEWLQCCKSLDELYEMVATFLTALLPNCAGSLYVYTNSRDVLDSVKAWNGATQTPPIQPDDCWSLRRGRSFTHGKSEIEFHCAHVGAPSVTDYCCIPILAHGETIGMLHLELHSDRTLGDENVRKEVLADQRRLGAVCAEQISMAIANVKLRDELRDQAVRDPLTGLFNRRYLLDTMRREISRARRMEQSVSVLLLDVDHFKRFNDSHGHDAGDSVLRAVGECLGTGFRNEDFACRFGGEEFLVVLAGASPAVAFRRGEELRGRIESIVVRYRDSNLPRISASIGVAAFPDCGDDPQAVIKAADEALYVAKQNGRNRVELASSLDPMIKEATTDVAVLHRVLECNFGPDRSSPESPGAAA